MFVFSVYENFSGWWFVRFWHVSHHQNRYTFSQHLLWLLYKIAHFKTVVGLITQKGNVGLRFLWQLLQTKWGDLCWHSAMEKKKTRRTKKGHFVMTNFYNKMNLSKYNNLKSDHNQTNEKKTRHSLIFTNGLLHLTLSKELLCRCFLLTPARKGKPKH